MKLKQHYMNMFESNSAFAPIFIYAFCKNVYDEALHTIIVFIFFRNNI